ncbi:hypothetical protein KC19_1G075800 [Ceratodon purpureus]|uniref:Uncharacterized protein n=1 Tax=Ceratodon purpureus TaxID=3225 RepID=A0A8T0J2J3_CERPU|nr:hypothetical protein KC19_1G075800 [Ceratodon purpureus]
MEMVAGCIAGWEAGVYLMIVIGCSKVSSSFIFNVPHVTPSFGEAAVTDVTVVCKLRILSPSNFCKNGLNRMVVPSIKYQ